MEQIIIAKEFVGDGECFRAYLPDYPDICGRGFTPAEALFGLAETSKDSPKISGFSEALKSDAESWHAWEQAGHNATEAARKHL